MLGSALFVFESMSESGIQAQFQTQKVSVSRRKLAKNIAFNKRAARVFRAALHFFSSVTRDKTQ